MHFPRILLVAAACALVPVAAFAEPPQGEFSVTVGGAAQLRLLDGETGPDCDNGLPTEICTSSSMHTDAAGDVTGTQTLVSEGTSDGTIIFVFNGTAKAQPGIAKSKLLFTPEGTLTTNGLVETASGQGKAFCRDDITTGDSFICDAKVRLCLESIFGLECNRFFTSMIFAEQQAPWDLDLVLATDERGAITGSAVATLGNGVVIDFTVTGKYNAKKDESALSVKGLGAGIKSKVKVKRLAVNEEGVLVAGRLKFKIAGQVGAFEISPPAPATASP